MDGYRRDRTVSAFASSTRANQGPLPALPPPPIPTAGTSNQHASNFRQRVKSDNARRPPSTSAQLQASYYLYSPYDANPPGARLSQSQQLPGRSPQLNRRDKTRLQPQPSQETSNGFVSFNSFLDGVGLPKAPHAQSPNQHQGQHPVQPRPMRSSFNASKSRPYTLSGAPSVPQSLLEPLSIEPGYSIRGKPDPSQTQSYTQNNSKSVQTLASSLNRHSVLSSGHGGAQHGHGEPVEEEAATLTGEQCWYLLRTLVELEIEDEMSKLWKLTGGLDAESVEWDSALECSSEEVTTTEE